MGPAGFPENPEPVTPPPPSGPDPAPSEAWGDLTAAATPSQYSDACQDELQAGQEVDVSGSGFVPGASVAVTLTSPGSAAVPAEFADPLATLTADQDGDVATTVQVPFSATGFNDAPGDIAFFDATGPGADATTQDDVAMVSLVAPTSSCAVAFPPASATVALSGADTSFLPVSGAVFEVGGQGLPGSVVGSPLSSPPAPGSFAELDTGPAGQTVCPPSEPAGVTCSGGTLEDLYPGTTYTVTELQAPPGYGAATPQDFTAPTDGSTTVVPVADNVLVGNFTTGSGAQNCTLCIMAPSGTGTLGATGAAKVGWGGPATVDSVSSTAVTGSGSAKLSGGSLFVAGGTGLSGAAKIVTTSGVHPGTVSDPFSWFQYPSLTSTATALNVAGVAKVVASPGTYSSITVSGEGKLTLSPGTYVVTGNISVGGSGQLTGQGATIYMKCSTASCTGSAAALDVGGSATVVLDGGAIGPGDGFSLLADRADGATVDVSGSGVLTATGTVYAPSASVGISGSGLFTLNDGEAVVSQLVASGSGRFNVTSS